MADDPDVTAEPPESPFHTTGTDHVTIWGSNEDDTLAFYRDLLGMSLVLRQPNLDDPSQTHLFFDTGDGRILTVFVSDDRPSNQGGLRTQTGGVHHLSFSIDPEEFADVMAALDDAGRGYNVFDRGVFHSLYTRDHNGLVVELAADRFDVPDDRRAEVLAETQRVREADGAEFAEERHMETALDNLGIETDAHDLPSAPSGAGTRR